MPRKVYDRDGQFLYYASPRKCEMYLRKNLATVHGGDGIKLKFTPRGLDKFNLKYFRILKPECCVVCGTKDNITTHHVVPRCYRKHMPKEYVTSYDVLNVCKSCHETYERIADKMKKQLEKELFDISDKSNIEKERKLVSAYHVAVEYLKDENRIHLLSKIYSKSGGLGPEEVVANGEPKRNYRSHGKNIVRKLSNIQEFIVTCRRHFIDTMSPRFMPEGYEVEAEVTTGTR